MPISGSYIREYLEIYVEILASADSSHWIRSFERAPTLHRGETRGHGVGLIKLGVLGDT